MTRRIPRRLSSVVALLAVVALVSGCVTITRTGPDELPDGSPASPLTVDRSPDASETGRSASDRTPGVSFAATGTGRAGAPIGYISFGEQLSFARAVTASVKEAAERRGVELVVCDSRLEPEGVRDCAVRLGEQGVRGAIVFGAFPELGADICEALEDVPVVGVAYDQGPCQVSLVGTDNHAAGVLAGEALGRFARDRWDCEISAWVSLESSAAGDLGAERMAGYRDGYERECELSDELVTVLDGTDRVVTAQRRVAELLEDVPGRRVLVVGINEDAVSGALEAARRADRQRDVWVSGQGADPSARRSIACDEHYVASVAHLPERFGEVLVPTLLDAIEGREVAAQVDTPVLLVRGDEIRELYPATPACEDGGDGE